MVWKVPKMWDGGTVYILGGGPSVLNQFNVPANITKGILNKSYHLNVLSPYLKPIHDKHVIGINVAYLIGDWIDMIFFGDNDFFLSHRSGLAKFPGLKVSCHNIVANYSWIKYLPWDKVNGRNMNEGISNNPESVRWNYNSGAAAISIAANAGAKRIVLLGFDMKMENDKPHWHNTYNSVERAMENKIPPYATHLRGFPQIAIDAKNRGIEILNCSPDSAITSFPKVNLKDIL